MGCLPTIFKEKTLDTKDLNTNEIDKYNIKYLLISLLAPKIDRTNDRNISSDC